MSLTAGSRLGSYEIVAFIGRGGMGEVYRARDVRLRRDVAVKVLPAAFAADAGRVRRFEQEARAVSALNHPNILTLFDLGQAGADYFMATEFIDGRRCARICRSAAGGRRTSYRDRPSMRGGVTAAHAAGHRASGRLSRRTSCSGTTAT
jgi:hypothetical protein